MPKAGIESGAVLSPDQIYRYVLWRRWGKGSPVCWVMLNPSTADHKVDDPTIKRCISFTEAWGFDALVVVNLFAIRATKFPEEVDDFFESYYSLYRRLVGYHTDDWIQRAVSLSSLVVAAWGFQGQFFNRNTEVYRSIEKRMWCLGKTDGGLPRHPLYVPKNRQLTRFLGSGKIWCGAG